jgi:cytosine/adenosine deaminase-related metal-dependent hydrolase
MTTREVALAATQGGARALGFGDRIGRIARGYQADLVLLDLDHPNWLPFNDPVNQLVHSEDGNAVHSVMIAGKMIVENRRVLNVDMERLRSRVEAARERLAAANADNRRLYAAMEPVVGSYCPGLADSRAMLDARVNLGIGTDGANCSDNQNMYEAMRLASFVSKVQGPEWRRWMTTREVALAATQGSARALGFGDRIGRIARGYQADLVLLDLDHPNWLPFNDPVNQLVHSEDGNAVHSVMIAGRMVVENRRVLNVDMERLRTRDEAARERLAAANADNRRLYDALEPVVGSYCPGLARTPYHVHRYGARPE